MPIAAIALARGVLERWPVVLLGAAVVGVVAVAGPALFLFQSWRAGGDWYRGYFETQLVASPVGAWTDGSPSALEP